MTHDTINYWIERCIGPDGDPPFTHEEADEYADNLPHMMANEWTESEIESAREALHAYVDNNEGSN